MNVLQCAVVTILLASYWGGV